MALTRTLLALVPGCAVLVVAPAAAWDADCGRVWRGDGVLKYGCTSYGFRYRVRPGDNHWAAEFFLGGPERDGHRRERLATVVKTSDAEDPKRGRGRFELCRTATRPGRFKIRGKLTITPLPVAAPR
jgi:hypothetical protein